MNLKIYEKTKYNNIYKHRKNGTYAVDLSLGYDNLGKRIRTTTTGLKTEKEARKLLSDEKIKKNKKLIITENLNFDDLTNEYFEWCLDYKRLKEETVKNKKSRFNQNIIPFFEKMKIIFIDDKEIVAWHKWLDKKDLCDQTKNTLHKQLSAYFNWLIKYKKIININPCKNVDNYKLPNPDIIHYTIDEMNLLFETIEKNSTKSYKTKLLIKAILKLFFFSGFRVGELFGLKFKDFNYDLINNNIITTENVKIKINQTVLYTTGGWKLESGKTEESLSTLFLGKNALQSLLDYLNYMKQFIDYNVNDYIFINPENKKIYSQENIRKHINYFQRKANLKHIALKDLRHSHATFLLSHGYKLEEVKSRLRHTSQRTTEKYYATFYDDVKKQLANDIDKFA